MGRKIDRKISQEARKMTWSDTRWRWLGKWGVWPFLPVSPRFSPFLPVSPRLISDA